MMNNLIRMDFYLIFDEFLSIEFSFAFSLLILSLSAQYAIITTLTVTPAIIKNRPKQVHTIDAINIIKDKPNSPE